jgi:hypothetical protein
LQGERIAIEYDFSAPRNLKPRNNGLVWNSIPSDGSMKGGASNSLLARMDKP